MCELQNNLAARVGPDGDALRVDGWFQGMIRAGPGRPADWWPEPFGAICVYAGKSVRWYVALWWPRLGMVTTGQARGQALGRGAAGRQELIRWPVLFSAPAQHATSLQIVRPLIGAITAVPAYTWQLGAGQQGRGLVTDTDSVDPRRPIPEAVALAGYYVGRLRD